MEEPLYTTKPSWTSRWLNVTCDRGQPDCTSCHNENCIPFRGYGEKPAFINGVENERKRVEYFTSTTLFWLDVIFSMTVRITSIFLSRNTISRLDLASALRRNLWL
jgi:hypothetical protein